MSKIKINLGDISESRINGKDVPEEQKSRLELTFKKPGENNPGERLRELFTEAQTICDQGSGVTITFEFNDGEKKSVYIDGDGADRIIEVVWHGNHRSLSRFRS